MSKAFKLTKSGVYVKTSINYGTKHRRSSHVMGFRVPSRPTRVLAQSADTGNVEEFELLFTRKSDYTRSKYLD